MADSKSTSSTLELNVPTYIPLPDAAQKHGLSEQALTQLIQAGKIDAVQLPSGELLVSANTNGQEVKTKQQIISEKFSHLRGREISASEGSRKYGKLYGISIPYQNFGCWADVGYIEVKSRGYRLQLNEADVARINFLRAAEGFRPACSIPKNTPPTTGGTVRRTNCAPGATSQTSCFIVSTRAGLPL